ncbi:hypothetical protein TNIN_17861 [Trichonephila inaurata madagascariensis]|uniref:Uncharacterized protein n=1 Tax=Trichonephila inaurata madagascariensis TaxID=2747483 RepID=A0A8X7BQF0_9ARAC|nr:hypothetical protein TNIN_17861 [Trichonephila inaurata madagascariensis]
MSENERLRDFIAQYVTCIEQDLEFDASFKDDAKEFYKNLLPEEAPEIKIPEEKSPDEPDKEIIPDETEEKAAE